MISCDVINGIRDAASDGGRVHQLLTEAVTVCRDIGMPKHVEMTEGMLGEA